MPSRFSVLLVAVALQFLPGTSFPIPAALEQRPALHLTPYSKQQFLRLPAAAVDTVEKHHLLAAGGRVVRRRGQLSITLTNGKVLRLTNYFSDTEVDRYVYYDFRGEIPALQSWVLEVRLWEGYYALVVDQRTGRQTRLWSPPVVAPDKKHFITCSADLETGYIPNGIQYWAIRDHSPVRLWEQQFESWAPEEARWIDASRIALKQRRLGTKAGTYRHTYVSGLLTP